jgi:hypothetical protein
MNDNNSPNICVGNIEFNQWLCFLNYWYRNLNLGLWLTRVFLVQQFVCVMEKYFEHLWPSFCNWIIAPPTVTTDMVMTKDEQRLRQTGYMKWYKVSHLQFWHFSWQLDSKRPGFLVFKCVNYNWTGSSLSYRNFDVTLQLP